jgi:hypothetical protein
MACGMGITLIKSTHSWTQVRASKFLIVENKPKPGDKVLWKGPDDFLAPKLYAVGGISDDGEWAFLQGVRDGVPMSEVTAQKPESPQLPPRNPAYGNPDGLEEPAKPGMETDRTNLAGGPVVLQWPSTLTKESVADLDYWIKGVLRCAQPRRASILTRTSGPIHREGAAMTEEILKIKAEELATIRLVFGNGVIHEMPLAEAKGYGEAAERGNAQLSQTAKCAGPRLGILLDEGCGPIRRICDPGEAVDHAPPLE